MKPKVAPPILMLVAALVMWALDRWLPLGRWIPSQWNRLSVIPAAAGLSIAAAAVIRFLRAGTTTNPMDPSKASQLVTGGVFGVSRNPMYLGLTLLLVGWALWLGSASPWLILPLFVIVITVAQILPEEQALGQVFGVPYAAYRRRVRRWVGRF